MERLKDSVFHANIDRSGLERITPDILQTNRIMSGTLSAVATLLTGVMFILSFCVEGFSQNRFVYLFGVILSATVLLLTKLSKQYEWLVTPVVYAAYSIYYLYGIFIGTITDPGNRTVTFIVMLVLMPTLFAGKTSQIAFVTCAYDLLFIALCFVKKSGPVLSVDVVDAIFFGALGIISGIIINRLKIQNYLSQKKLQEVSRTDQLTQMNNRNAFEMDLFSISSKCRHSLACLYIDVNGLHELNNAKGHKYGDEMLQFVAEAIKNAFSEEYTYRIGGDEFVAFIPDTSKADVGYKVTELSKLVNEEGYHIATGYESMPLRQLSIDYLIKSAETNMFRDKAQYYNDIASREVRKKTK